jgi:hypothetical protein
MQAYIVRCTAKATIGEAWRVFAASDEEAIGIVSCDIEAEESAELLRDWVIGDEEGRYDFCATLEADEERADTAFANGKSDFVDALVAAQLLLTNLRAHELDDEDSVATMAAIDAAIRKARGEQA